MNGILFFEWKSIVENFTHNIFMGHKRAVGTNVYKQSYKLNQFTRIVINYVTCWNCNKRNGKCFMKGFKGNFGDFACC